MFNLKFMKLCQSVKKSILAVTAFLVVVFAYSINFQNPKFMENVTNPDIKEISTSQMKELSDTYAFASFLVCSGVDCKFNPQTFKYEVDLVAVNQILENSQFPAKGVKK